MIGAEEAVALSRETQADIEFQPAIGVAEKLGRIEQPKWHHTIVAQMGRTQVDLRIQPGNEHSNDGCIRVADTVYLHRIQGKMIVNACDGDQAIKTN
ncbi:hypothetical protein CXP47_18430 [Pseudomonas chlororaphis]|nr:hypothetical protein EY04_18780 [Pseudomonas chlororaphis]AUG41771.1 hypothetical protein CXP47_18430 [Pseudomonas chlororaphis]PWY48052.1 hypothetical protein DK261_08865 [Pseudomonas sp. RW409]QHC90323.1 hypothetical protein PchlR47_19065 [Pseudomonas chlororaphis]